MIEEKIEQDLKAALLGGDKAKVETLRLIRSVILNVKVNSGTRNQVMSDDQVIQLLTKEAKKRQESADLYVQGGSQERATKELSEKAIIDAYLPAQLSESEISSVVDEIINATENPNMGQVIGQVKSKLGPSADGGTIARLVKARLNV